MKTHSPAGILCLLAASSCLHAAPISVGDPSFEANSPGELSAGSFSNSIGPEWTGSGGSNSGNAFEERISGFASQGTDHLGMELNYNVWQNLGVTYQANTRYTLTVGVGNRSGVTVATNASQYYLANSAGTLYASGSTNASTVPVGTFADAPALIFDTPNNPAAVGQTIQIRLRAGGANRSHFDNIRLDAAPIVPTPPTVINLNAIAVTGNSATLRGKVTEAGSTVPTVTIFYGPADGGTNPDNWANTVSLGSQSSTFTAPASGIPVNTTWYYRARAVNTEGTAWAPESASFTTTSGVIPASAVINEFQEKPEDNHELEEFIELHNPGDTDLNIGGWTLANAVTYTIPLGTILPAHGYKVIAMNPAAIQARYGFTPLGPWSGKLSSGGETIELKQGNTVKDSVAYVPGFPWPSAIDGEGPSAELINPGIDNNLGGSWRASNGLPTPGAPNSRYMAVELTPPHIQTVAHSPQQPTANQAVTVTAKITDPDGMGAVSLEYQLVEPGSYIHVSDPIYTTSWTSVPMVDNGNLGDATAGDSVYTAVLPGNLQTHRRLVRYRITFQDLPGNTQRVPYADDLQSNFAYFVYDTMPAWSGSLRPGTNPVQAYSAAALSAIPVYTLIANGTDVINTQYVSGYDEDRFRGTLVYNGVVYDNIEFRNRGQGSTYQSGKNKWRFYFNPARDFHAKDHFGKDYTETWGSFSVNACAAPWAPVHRGSAGVEEASSLKLFGLAGVPSPSSHYFHLRVIRGANETPAAGTQVTDPIATSGTTDGQYAGDFWGLYLAIERFKGNFLDERGMEDGNIYKIEGGAGEPERLLPGVAPDSADWNAFRNIVEGSSAPTEDWWRANMDMPNYYTFHAINRLIGNIDLRAGENHFFYHRPSDERWVVMPWDLDMMYIPMGHQGSTINGTSVKGVIKAHRALMDHPALALEFRNRAREVLDLLASDSSANGGQMGQLLDEYAQIVAPTGTTDNLANADAAMWNLHPRTRGNDGQHNGQSNHKGNFFYSPYNDDRMSGSWVRYLRSPSFTGVGNHADMMNYFRDYVTNAWPGGTWQVNNGKPAGYGYQYLLSESADTAIPAKPTITYTGGAGYPRNDLSFSASPFSDPQGAGSYAATQWRLAEITAPGIPGYVVGSPRKYEIENGWSVTSTGSTITLPTSVAQTGKTFRARVRYQDNTGRWSNWSNPIQFGSAAADETLVHYWNFNTVDDVLTPAQSIGGTAITLQNNTAGNAKLLYDPSASQGFNGANGRNGSPVGGHLRANNTAGASITFALPTTGYNNLVAAVEVRRSSAGSAAELEAWSYSTNNGTTYTPIKTVTISADAPAIVELDLRAVLAASNNPDFRLKVDIIQGAGGVEGNHRFDNFTLTGKPIPGTYAAWIKTAFTEAEQINSAISNAGADPDRDGLSNFLEFALATQPKKGDASGVTFTWSADGATRYPGLRFKRPQGIVGVAYELLASDTVGGWNPVSTTIVGTTALGGGVEEAVIRDTQTDANPKRFLRLKVKSTP